MSNEAGSPRGSSLTPEEAFGILGHEVRLQILHVLDQIEEPAPFSELFDHVEYPTESNFSYHLERLTGHFVEKNDDGYRLTGPGGGIIDAIAAGTITEAPVIPRTEIDQRCHFCGEAIEVRYADERLERFCTNCDGMWGSGPAGYLGSLALPPAGFENRTVEAAVRAAWIRQLLELYGMAAKICPRCSDRLELEPEICGAHASAGGRCRECGNRYATRVAMSCRTCRFARGGSPAILVLSEREFTAFLAESGIHPVLPDDIPAYHAIVSDFEEEVRSVEPVEVDLTFEAGGERLTARIDGAGAIRWVH